MSAVADVDLSDRSARSDPVLEPTRYLVRFGTEVLGSVDVTPSNVPARFDLREELTRHFSDEIRSRVLMPRPPAALSSQDVTIVVCTRDRPDLLRVCLQHLAHLDPPPAEVLVVDNASSTTQTRQVALAAGARCLDEPRPGLDRARDLGWRAADTAVVAYVDDDARVDPGYAASIARGFLDEQVGAVTGLVAPAELRTPAQRLFERQGGMGKGYRREVHRRSEWAYGMQPHRLGVGTAMAFRRAALERIAGFDPRLDVGTPTRGGGDLDALFRTMLDGWTVVYEPDAVIRHLHRRDWRGLLQQMRDNGTAYAALLEMYETERPELSAAARRERRSWHWRRHVRGVLGAARRRDAALLMLLLAEAQGSRHGRKAWRAAGPGGAP